MSVALLLKSYALRVFLDKSNFINGYKRYINPLTILSTNTKQVEGLLHQLSELSDIPTLFANHPQENKLIWYTICSTLTVPPLKMIMFWCTQKMHTPSIHTKNCVLLLLFCPELAPCCMRCSHESENSPWIDPSHISICCQVWAKELQEKNICSVSALHLKQKTHDGPGLKVITRRCCKAI